MRFFIYIILLIAFAPLQSLAQTEKQPHVTLDVLADRDAVVAGETLTLAVRQTIHDNWHTYWLNAGDSGEGMTVNWQNLPKGFEIGAMQHPAPGKIFYDPLMNYGYYGAPVFLFDVTVPDTIDTDSVTFQADAFWLVCDEICIPEESAVSLTLPVAETSDASHTALFKRARDAIPEKVDWATSLSQSTDTTTLSITLPEGMDINFDEIELFPYEWGIINNAAEAASAFNPDTRVLTITQSIGDRNKTAIEALNTTDFVIKTPDNAFQVTAKTTLLSVKADANPQSLLIILSFALLGGLILNLMPCVFPVLSMKALSLINLSAKERRHAQTSGIAYTLGIVLSFVFIAAILIALKAAGESIGWGFQLQNPLIVTLLAVLLFAIGLNLSGVFDIKGRLVNLGSHFTQGNNLKASFFTGVLATIVATPCSAPFMASAIGFALTQNAFIALLIFAVLGVGLALPYLILCFVPQTQKFLPKPGAWMETFRQFLAFPMFASAIWLVWVLSRQTGSAGVLYALAAMLGFAFVIWLVKKHAPKYISYGLAIAVVIGLLITAPFIQPVQKNAVKNFEIYSQSKLDDILRNNPDEAVFVNMTASWCITCLVNERVALSNDSVKALFAAKEITYLKGDWTNKDEEITRFLEKYDRNGVPLYVYYRPAPEKGGKRPKEVILPQILTPQIVKDIINK